MDDRGAAWGIAAYDAAQRVWGVALASTEPAASVHRLFAVGDVGACVTVGTDPAEWQGRWVLGILAQGLAPAAALEDLGRADAGARAAWACVGPTGESGAAAWGSGYAAHAEPGWAVAVRSDLEAAGRPEAAAGEVWRAAQPLALEDRLVAMLQAVVRRTGVREAVRSAALVTACGSDDGGQRTRALDLRVDDHADPLAELERLCDVVALRRCALRDAKRPWTADVREAVGTALTQMGAAQTGDAAEDVPDRLRAWLQARRMGDGSEISRWVTPNTVEEHVYRAVRRAAARHCVGSIER